MARVWKVPEAHIAQPWPFVEAQVYNGGQPHHPLLVGIE